MLINSTISLVLNDSTSIDTYTTGSIFSNSGGSIRLEFQLPIIFSKSVIRIVGKYITLLKDQSNLEQLFGSTNLSPINPSIPTSLAYLLNFLLPLLFWSASDRKDSPRLNSNDLSFVVNMILNALKPPSKLAATLLLQAPKQHLLNAFDTNPQSAAKSTKQIKDLITQSTYLTLKLLTFSFTKLIDLIKIATTIRQICFKCKNIYLWKFLDFVSTNRTPLFLLLKPFIENFVATQTCESELESQLRHTIQNKLNYLNPIDVKCTNSVLDQLIEELNTIKLESNGDLKPDKEAKLDAHEDNMLNVTKYEDKSASVSSPGRNLAFKFNRAKKDSTMTSPSSSMNSTPRKKFEKLNYKSGADILDIYKAKLKAKQMAKESEKEMENLTNINLVAANESNEQKFSFVERESALRTDEPFRPRPSMSSMSRQSTEASSAGLIDKTNEQNSEPSQTETSDSKSNDQTFKQNKKPKSKKIFFV
ncbi:hypothetical protein BpHYR1_016282 [Brachionus plicatilis]|uniref:Protein UNC80 C-terminal domain-containing protein n=1 Tax=Brachionus plicatilis TaxID=10195 RepID=A0A3M7QQQ0_BRAPC|nr:hypothetical protein BpHYR1_016282 [Brachionus plicatilis]